jgi:hypothetical protein
MIINGFGRKKMIGSQPIRGLYDNYYINIAMLAQKCNGKSVWGQATAFARRGIICPLDMM